jgi:hypothetical protein
LLGRTMGPLGVTPRAASREFLGSDPERPLDAMRA